MRRVATFIVSAVGLAAPVLAQNQFELRVVPVDPSAFTNGTATSFAFTLEARALATTGGNFGVVRAGPMGSAVGTRSSIVLTDAPVGTQIGRGELSTGASLRGRDDDFRFLDPRHGDAQDPALYETAFTNGPNQTSPTLLEGNENGYVQNSGGVSMIAMFDAYKGFSRPNTGTGNPWGLSVATGEWSPWETIYSFVVVAPSAATFPGYTLSFSYQAGLAMGTNTQLVGSSYLIQTSAMSMTRGTFSTQVIPGATPAAGLAMTGLLAARRRRRAA